MIEVILNVFESFPAADLTVSVPVMASSYNNLVLASASITINVTALNICYKSYFKNLQITKADKRQDSISLIKAVLVVNRYKGFF